MVESGSGTPIHALHGRANGQLDPENDLESLQDEPVA